MSADRYGDAGLVYFTLSIVMLFICYFQQKFISELKVRIEKFEEKIEKLETERRNK